MNSQPIFDIEEVKAAVQKVNDAWVYIASTGAGAGITNLLWQRAGASKFLVGSSFPYHPTEFDDFVGKTWRETGHGNCSFLGAVALAQASYYRAERACFASGKKAAQIIGVGVSAAAATDRTLKGGTRCFGAVRNRFGIFWVEVWMEQGFLEREGDGSVCDLIALNLILYSLGQSQVLFPQNLRLTSKHFHLQTDGDREGLIFWPDEIAPPTLSDDLRKPVVLSLDGTLGNLDGFNFSNTIVFPGSFQPFHFGHNSMARTAELFTEKSLVCEITANNADKSEQSLDELAERGSKLVGRWPVILRTSAGLFVDKAQDYRGASFLVGADTALRVIDTNFYGSVRQLGDVLEQFAQFGTRFYVFRRQVGDRLVECEDVYDELCRLLYSKYMYLFKPLPGCWDVSSTAIRETHVA